MLCKYPQPLYSRDRDTFRPCGQCDHCRINIRREKKHRMMLEARCHPVSSFLTLTYDDDHLPEDCSVDKEHHQTFIDNFQVAFKRKFKRKLRYFMCGEYGEKTERPHYHYILFGYPPCPSGGARWVGKKYVPCTCEICKFISDRWPYGHILLGTFTPESAQYVAGYVQKKMTSNSSEYQEWWLSGRAPEFSCASRRPGLGYDAVDYIVSALTKYGISDSNEFPRFLMHGTEKLPLGRYLSDKVKKRMGIEYDPVQRKRSLAASMPFMQVNHADFASVFSDSSRKAILSDASVSAVMQLLNSQRCLNAEGRQRMYKKESAF